MCVKICNKFIFTHTLEGDSSRNRLRSDIKLGMMSPPLPTPSGRVQRHEMTLLQMQKIKQRLWTSRFRGNDGRRMRGGSGITAGFQFPFQVGADSLQAFGRGGFKAKDQRGLRVGGANETPPVIEADTNSINRDDVSNHGL